jgi:hypothetical protein
MRYVLACLLLLFSAPALAQNPAVHQSGNVTPGHVPAWVTSGVIGDGGTAASSNVTSFATNSPGPANCADTAVKSPYYQVCLGTSVGTAGFLSFSSVGGLTALPFQFLINGQIAGQANGTSTKFASTNGPVTNGDCLSWQSGYIVDNGATCPNGVLVTPQYQSFTSPGTISSVTLTKTPLPTNANVVTVTVDGLTQAPAGWNLNTTSGVITFSPSITYTHDVTVYWAGPSPAVAGVGSITINGTTYSGTVTLPTTLGGASLATVYNPIDYGAVGSGVADDTHAWQLMCSAIQSAGTGWIVSPPGKTYKIFSSAASVSFQIACQLNNVNGIHVDMNGSKFLSTFGAQIVFTGPATGGGETVGCNFSSYTGAFSTQQPAITPTANEPASSMATAYAAAINANATLTAAGITAVASGAVVNIDPGSQITWFIGLVNGGTTCGVLTSSGAETLTLSSANVFVFEGSQNIWINDLIGTAYSGLADSGRGNSVDWVGCSNAGGSGFGCRNLSVHRANINGGRNGVFVVRVLGTGQWSENIHVDGIFQQVGYPVALEDDGINTDFDITTTNSARSTIFYNMHGLRGRIYHTQNWLNAGLEQVVPDAYSFQNDLSANVTTDWNIKYLDYDSTDYGNAFLFLSHQQGDPVNCSLPTGIFNGHIEFGITFNNTPTTFLFGENSFTGCSGNESLGDPGNTDSNIVVTGTVNGVTTGSKLGCFLAASACGSSGFNGTSTGNYAFRDFSYSATGNLAFGEKATVLFNNTYTPNAATPSYDAGYTASQAVYQPPVNFSGTIIGGASCSGSSSVTVVHGGISSC